MTDRPEVLDEYDAQGQAHVLRQILDSLPIHAVKIGYRTDSTPEQREFADAVFELHKRWEELRGHSGG